MSQSLLITGVYKNNKKVVVGMHNPKNNRVFNKEERHHLNKMFKSKIKPNLHKFKELHLGAVLQSGEHLFTLFPSFTFKNLLQIYRTVLTDKIQ